MTDEIILSPEAEEDLLEIWLYIAEDCPVNADRYLDRFQERMTILGTQINMGVARPELEEGLRSFPIDDYVVYYQLTPGVEIVRVLRGSRDIRNFF
jgi:plasmid stabilization system protein ParE